MFRELSQDWMMEVHGRSLGFSFYKLTGEWNKCRGFEVVEDDGPGVKFGCPVCRRSAVSRRFKSIRSRRIRRPELCYSRFTRSKAFLLAGALSSDHQLFASSIPTRQT